MSIYQNRLKKLNRFMVEKKLEAVLISKRENYIYYSGFNGSSAYLLITPTKRWLITDSRYIQQAGLQAEDYEIVDYKAKLAEVLSEILKEEGIHALGLESGYISFDTYKKYETQSISGELVPLGNEIDKLRAIKDADEILKIKKAAEIADNAFTHVLKYIKPGVTEIDIAAEIEYYFKKNGAKGASFETIIASGSRASLPHGIASDKKIEIGDCIIMDYGSIYDDYCSDMTRTVFVGTPTDEMAKVYKIVQEAQEVAVHKVSKGMTGKEADLIARNVIDTYGYGIYFGHGLGHGVGIEVHEEPTVSPRSDTVFENNMIITVEPGIYLPGVGGVRIEDMAVICDNTPEILTRSSKELISL